MSWDVWLEADLGGLEPSRIAHEHLNYTYNVSRMFQSAGIDLDGCNGQLAASVAASARRAAAAMAVAPGVYAAMNPENGWGDSEGARHFLERIAHVCEQHPRARVAVG